MALWQWFWKGSQQEIFQNQCHSTIGPCPIDRTALSPESSGAVGWELASWGELERAGRSWGELGRAGATWERSGGDPGRAGTSQGELGRAGATWSELDRPGPSRGELAAIQGELGRSRAQEIKEHYTYTLIGSALQGNSR